MKATILTSILFLTAAAQAALPEGRFQGQGKWQDSRGNKGAYQVNVTGAPGSLTSHYLYGNQKQDLAITVKDQGQGFFELQYEGKTSGTGYCMTEQCHYAIPAADLEETIVTTPAGFRRVGSKVVKGTRIIWEESLQSVPKK